MRIKRVLLIGLCLLLAACNLQRATEQPNNDNQSLLATAVAAAAQTLTQEAAPLGQTPLATITLPPPALPTTTFTATSHLTNTPEPGFGSVSGGIIGYPYGALPSLTIVAHEQNPPYHYWYLILPAGTTYYSMDGYVSTGKYQVVAYDSSGHTGGCTTIVEVKKNEMVTCDITNWGPGYPAKPAGVP